MLLYVNGDSHSCGHDAGGIDFSYGKYLSDLLSADFVCDAEARRSNYTILNRTKDYLKNTKPDLVVIGWSGWEREVWNIDGKKIDITGNMDLFLLPDEYQLKYKSWVIDNATQEIQFSKELYWHNEIWKLHEELNYRNIKHVFFNAFMDFRLINGYRFPKKDWRHNYINPYVGKFTYYNWCIHRGFVPSKGMHLNTDAHEAWANFLFKIVKEL